MVGWRNWRTTAIDASTGFGTSAEVARVLDSCAGVGTAGASRRGAAERRNFLVANIAVADIDSDIHPPERTAAVPSDSDNSHPADSHNPTSQRNFLPANSHSDSSPRSADYIPVHYPLPNCRSSSTAAVAILGTTWPREMLDRLDSKAERTGSMRRAVEVVALVMECVGDTDSRLYCKFGVSINAMLPSVKRSY